MLESVCASALCPASYPRQALSLHLVIRDAIQIRGVIVQSGAWCTPQAGVNLHHAACVTSMRWPTLSACAGT
jgi:hypothetical protein